MRHGLTCAEWLPPSIIAAVPRGSGPMPFTVIARCGSPSLLRITTPWDTHVAGLLHALPLMPPCHGEHTPTRRGMTARSTATPYRQSPPCTIPPYTDTARSVLRAVLVPRAETGDRDGSCGARRARPYGGCRARRWIAPCSYGIGPGTMLRCPCRPAISARLATPGSTAGRGDGMVHGSALIHSCPPDAPPGALARQARNRQARSRQARRLQARGLNSRAKSCCRVIIDGARSATACSKKSLGSRVKRYTTRTSFGSPSTALG